jgi:general L-amino acid transport system substrate-binding protein
MPALLAIAILVLSGQAEAQDTAIPTIRSRGELVCGVSSGAPGFAMQDRGRWSGFNVDSCRAVAAAVLGDAAKLRIVAVGSPASAFEALQARQIDLAVANLTWTLGRTIEGIVFPVIHYHDGQGFLVSRATTVNTLLELNNARICVRPGTTSDANLTAFIRQSRMRHVPVPVATDDAARRALMSGDCAALTGDTSDLAGIRLGIGARAANYMLLAEVISREPLSPAVRRDERDLEDVVRWTHFAQVAAEENNIDSATIESLRESQVTAVRAFFGRGPGQPALAGLEPDWAAKVIRQVGNYGEVWERNIAPIGLNRGLNSLWTTGGLMFAPPMR